MSKSLLHSKRSKAYALLLLNTILWGFSPPIIKQALNFITPSQLLFGRYVLASLIFLPIYFLTRKRADLEIRNLKLVILLALLGTPLTLIPLYEGIKLTTSIEAAILTATTPILVILGGYLFLKEKVSTNEKLGVGVALAGTLLLAFEPLLSDGSGFRFSLLGNFLILGSNFIWVAFLLLIKKLKTDASQISLVSYLVSIPVFALLIFLESPQIPALSISEGSVLNFNALFGIVYMAIFGSIIAFWAYTKGQEYVEAGEASVFTYLQPVFTFPLAFFWLGETISRVGLLACLLIAAGVYFSEYHARSPKN